MSQSAPHDLLVDNLIPRVSRFAPLIRSLSSIPPAGFFRFLLYWARSTLSFSRIPADTPRSTTAPRPSRSARPSRSSARRATISPAPTPSPRKHPPPHRRRTRRPRSSPKSPPSPVRRPPSVPPRTRPSTGPATRRPALPSPRRLRARATSPSSSPPPRRGRSRSRRVFLLPRSRGPDPRAGSPR
jgi:hypothetical protein